MEKAFDIISTVGLALLALTLFWVGTYAIKHKRINRGLLFILFGLLILILLAKQFLLLDKLF
ncbi:hypothetical protein SDC9_09111 [bioreactor metagenome]|uniref:Uncharacterized protein n=1 Tax=bioreactor metagenome TaxID=1076179 RepID=A0A644T989_9ZZZZ|nr:hypothetical protein [Negativicutes bacterium]